MERTFTLFGHSVSHIMLGYYLTASGTFLTGSRSVRQAVGKNTWRLSDCLGVLPTCQLISQTGDQSQSQNRSTRCFLIFTNAMCCHWISLNFMSWCSMQELHFFQIVCCSIQIWAPYQSCYSLPHQDSWSWNLAPCNNITRLYVKVWCQVPNLNLDILLHATTWSVMPRHGLQQRPCWCWHFKVYAMTLPFMS